MSVFSIVAGLCLMQAAGAQVNWLEIFRLSAAHEEGAVRQSFSDLDAAMRRTVEESPELVRNDIIEISRAFDLSLVYRQDASAVLMLLSTRRTDSQFSMQAAFPLWTGQLVDPVPKIRQNAARAIASLRPHVPEALIDVLGKHTKDSDSVVAGIAMYGLARESGSSLAARTRITDLLAPTQPVEVRVKATEQAGWARVQAGEILELIAEEISNDNKTLAQAAIEAADRIGARSEPVRSALERAFRGDDQNLRSAAKQTLEKIFGQR